MQASVFLANISASGCIMYYTVRVALFYDYHSWNRMNTDDDGVIIASSRGDGSDSKKNHKRYALITLDVDSIVFSVQSVIEHLFA
jgi:hypothetical protein